MPADSPLLRESVACSRPAPAVFDLRSSFFATFGFGNTANRFEPILRSSAFRPLASARTAGITLQASPTRRTTAAQRRSSTSKLLRSSHGSHVVISGVHEVEWPPGGHEARPFALHVNSSTMHNMQPSCSALPGDDDCALRCAHRQSHTGFASLRRKEMVEHARSF